MPQPTGRVCIPWTGPTFVLCLTGICLALLSKPSAQNLRPAAIQFTNVTEAAGIKFKHFKGNQGVSINREEMGAAFMLLAARCPNSRDRRWRELSFPERPKGEFWPRQSQARGRRRDYLAEWPTANV